MNNLIFKTEALKRFIARLQVLLKDHFLYINNGRINSEERHFNFITELIFRIF